MIKDGRMTQYFIKVKSSTETTPSTEPEYWSKQIISGTQANLFYNLGNVGIGVPNPLGKLQVDGSAGIGSAFATYAPPTDGLIVVGNVGIGTSAPAHKLHVIGDARIEGNLIVNGTQTIIDTDVQTTERLDITNNGTGPALRVNQTGASDVIDILDNGVSVLCIKDGGYVGIGTTTPLARLHVEGSVYFAEQRFKDLMIDSGGATAHQMFAIRGDGELMSWGGNVANQNLGLGTADFVRPFPTRVAMPFGKKVKYVTGNYHGCTALTTDNKLYRWGYVGAGIGYGSTTALWVPRRIIVEGTVVKIFRSSLSRGGGSTYLLNDQGDIFRSGEHPILGTLTTFTKLARPANSTWKDFNASGHSIWAWAVDGKAYSMGYNTYGELGDGTNTNRTSWVPILKADNTQLDNIKNIKWCSRYDGVASVYFILNTNDVWVTGHNGWGTLGLGTTAVQYKAFYLTNNVRDVNPSTGSDACVSIVKTDGSLWACGANPQGQVGNGTTTSLNTLTQIRENGTSGNFITGVKSVFGCAAGDNGVFIKEDGSVWATGINHWGSLGLGGDAARTVYTQVLLGEPIETIRQWHWYGWPGADHYTGTYFLARSGRLYSCGYNTYGSAGVGHSVTFNVPSQVILSQ